MGPWRVPENVSGFQLPVSRSETDGFSVPGSLFPECGEAQSLSARQISSELSKNWPQIKEQMLFLGRHLTKWSLVKSIGILSEARKSRFLRRKTPKYGSMNKGFTEEELERFFSVVDDPKAHLLFSYQAVLGLRIGEAVRVNVKDINLKTRELRIFTEKSDKTDYLLIPEKLFEATLSYISAYEKDIAVAKGHLFFSFQPGRRTERTVPHITSNCARIIFNKYVKKAKMDEIYGYSVGERTKQLYRLSTHSLRHYAITNFCRKNGGNVALSSKFARHTSLQTTMIYVHTAKNELYESIERANNDELLEKVRKMQEETRETR